MPAATKAVPAARPYKVLVWGASGFTGRLVCEHLAKDYAVCQLPQHLGLREKSKHDPCHSETHRDTEMHVDLGCTCAKNSVPGPCQAALARKLASGQLCKTLNVPCTPQRTLHAQHGACVQHHIAAGWWARDLQAHARVEQSSGAAVCVWAAAYGRAVLRL